MERRAVEDQRLQAEIRRLFRQVEGLLVSRIVGDQAAGLVRPDTVGRLIDGATGQGDPWLAVLAAADGGRREKELAVLVIGLARLKEKERDLERAGVA